VREINHYLFSTERVFLSILYARKANNEAVTVCSREKKKNKKNYLQKKETEET
jgi:hypothetical protein